MLEWYRVGIDHRALMSEVEALVHTALNNRVKFGPTETLTYREAFELHTGLDPGKPRTKTISWTACAPTASSPRPASHANMTTACGATFCSPIWLSHASVRGG